MTWKRFPVPEFDYRSLKQLVYEPPTPISAAEAARIAEAAATGDRSVAGGYAVEPDAGLLDRLVVRGAYRHMILCALPGQGAHLLGRSYAWYNQRAFVLDRNGVDAETLHLWTTPRTTNTRFGPEEGVVLDRAVVYLISGRILSDHTRANRVMIDRDWSAGTGTQGFRILAACDDGPDNFHDSYFELRWDA